MKDNIVIKTFLCTIYLTIIAVLVVCVLHISEEKEVYFTEREKAYSYIEVNKMSEKFAYDKKTNIGFHFVIDKENKIYLIAINEKKYNDYKDIIDYSYERIDKVPKNIKVYGYPVSINKKLKELSNSNIEKFSNEKLEETNYYLNTTIKKKDNILIKVFSIISILILIILFFITLFDKGKRTT